MSQCRNKYIQLHLHMSIGPSLGIISDDLRTVGLVEWRLSDSSFICLSTISFSSSIMISILYLGGSDKFHQGLNINICDIQLLVIGT